MFIKGLENFDAQAVDKLYVHVQLYHDQDTIAWWYWSWDSWYASTQMLTCLYRTVNASLISKCVVFSCCYCCFWSFFNGSLVFTLFYFTYVTFQYIHIILNATIYYTNIQHSHIRHTNQHTTHTHSPVHNSFTHTVLRLLKPQTKCRSHFD